MPLRNSKTLKIELSNCGSYLGRGAVYFEVRDKNGKVETYPHFEKQIGECVLKSGNYVSVDDLIDLALWNIDTYIMTKRNKVVAVLKNLEDDSHVKTRISQYQALTNGKGEYVAKQIVKCKIERARCRRGQEVAPATRFRNALGIFGATNFSFFLAINCDCDSCGICRHMPVDLLQETQTENLRVVK